jgi:hypothetical protein
MPLPSFGGAKTWFQWRSCHLTLHCFSSHLRLESFFVGATSQTKLPCSGTFPLPEHLGLALILSSEIRFSISLKAGRWLKLVMSVSRVYKTKVECMKDSREVDFAERT